MSDFSGTRDLPAAWLAIRERIAVGKCDDGIWWGSRQATHTSAHRPAVASNLLQFMNIDYNCHIV